jgi:Zn-dependent protease
MATLGAFVFRALNQTGVLLDLPQNVVLGIYYFVAFNVLLAIFNLIPVPPLDGSALLYRFLSPAQAWKVRPILSQYGFILIIGVFLLAGGYISRFIGDVTNFLVGV